MKYQPPFTITSKIASLLAEISEHIGHLSAIQQQDQLRLRRINRIRTIQGSLAIEGNTLSEEQVTAILEGKPVMAPPREIQEVRNAIQAYEQLATWQANQQDDLLKAHQCLMQGLIDDAGHYRLAGVGVMSKKEVVHMAPPANRVPALMADLFAWLDTTKEHPLIASCVFHYEFEFIHPFSDGNGRMGRLWQTLILTKWRELFQHLPVESLIYTHQADYYQALNASTEQSDSVPFIEFMLSVIAEACVVNNTIATSQDTPQDTPYVTPQVIQLLDIFGGEMGAKKLLQQLSLKDRKSFRERYLQPALSAGFIEMTLPDKPSSSLQKYRLTTLGKEIKLHKGLENG